MTSYFVSPNKRLFRITDTDVNERWDKETKGWVDVEDYVSRTAVQGASPGFVEVEEAVAAQGFPAAFQGDLTDFEKKASAVTPQDGEVTLTDTQAQTMLLALAQEILDAAGPE